MSTPLLWQPHAPAVVIAVIAVGTCAWAWFLRRELARRWGEGGLWTLLAPKCALLALLVLALLDPSLERSDDGDAKRSLLVLIDQSSSMDVRDGPHGETRRERAERIADAVAAPSGITIAKRWFDSELREQPTPPGGAERGTDLAACLQAAARSSGDCVGAVVISDGGDEPASLDGLLALPISAVGVGGDGSGWTDLAIADLQAPATAERGVAFAITADVAASGPAAFLSRLTAVPAVLERQDAKGGWSEVERQPLDASHGRARAGFRVKADQVGAARYRVSVPEMTGEISALDNRRAALVDVRERSLHVLYFSRTLGLGFKPLRAELARDAGISFTALYRTVGGRLSADGGERFTVQGDRVAGDDDLDAGFPATASALQRYDVVILGSFAASTWSQAQQRALAEHVANGGAVVFLGGEDSFGAGGYAGSPLAPLMPWQIADGEAALSRGDFPVSVPPEATAHAVTQGVAERLGADATIASLNHPGALRGGATALLLGNVGGETVALAAAQPYGKGKVLGIASDTLWRLTRAGGDSAYGVFWRQAVRWLGDRGEGGQVLRVTWDRAAYRPGDTARATVRVAAAGGRCRISAALEHDAARSDLAPTAAAASEGEAWTIAAPFTARGDWKVRIVAYRDGATLETYEKTFAVAPSLPEGARLPRDDAGLSRLAGSHGGVYAKEDDLSPLQPWLAATARAQRTVQARSLVFSSPWWLVVVIGLMLMEWIVRRRRNLI